MRINADRIYYQKYYNKKIKFKDKEKFEYTGTAIEYESKTDAGNGICGELFVDIATSNNQDRKEGQSWSFLVDDIMEIEEINQ